MSFVYKDWSDLSYREVKDMIENTTGEETLTADYKNVEIKEEE